MSTKDEDVSSPAQLPEKGELDSNTEKSARAESAQNSDDPEEVNWRSWSFFWKVYSMVACSLLYMGCGFTFVFSSPLLDELIRDANSTPWIEGFDSCSYQGLIAPSVLIGSIPGSLLGAILSAILGLHITILLAAVCFALSWGLIGASWFMPSAVLFRTLILTGRTLTGVWLGYLTAVLPVYSGEISPSRYRTAFLGTVYSCYAIGTTITYVLGAFLPYWISSFIYCGMVTATIPMLLFIEESPLRTRNVSVNMKKLIASLRGKKLTQFSLNTAFLTRLTLSNLLYVSHVCMGYIAIIQYVGPILNVAGAQEWNVPHGVLIAITVGGGDIIGSIMTILFSPRLNHVFSAFIGSVGITLGHVMIAVFFFLVTGFNTGQLVDESPTLNVTINNSTSGLVCFFEPAISGELGQQYSPIALIGISIVMLMFGTFWMVQPFVIVVEMFPDDQRDLGSGIATMFRLVLDMLVSYLFPYVNQAIGTGITFLLFAIIAALTAIILPCVIPETKGRPMGERGGEFTPKQNLKEFLGTCKSYCCCCFPCKK